MPACNDFIGLIEVNLQHMSVPKSIVDCLHFTNATIFSSIYLMGREKRGGYLIEWWIGDHNPKHVHIYKDGKEVAKVTVPNMRVLSGRLNTKLRKIIEALMEEGKI